jgi:hypothetical protein
MPEKDLRSSWTEWTTMVWVIAVFLFGMSEAIILHSQIRVPSLTPWSLNFWYLPIMIAAPLGSSINIYRTIARASWGAEGTKILVSRSFYIPHLVCISYATTILCVTRLFGY